MHDTAYFIGDAFLKSRSRWGQTIVEVGSYNVNGSIRASAHPEATYIGVDIESGPGVDVIASDDCTIPLESNCADLVIATSVFEHSSFFWLLVLEMFRIAKDGGEIYVNAPSNGIYHRHPNDNWRFYPDAGKMFERRGQRNGYKVSLIESFIAERQAGDWNDFVAILQIAPAKEPKEYLSDRFACTNVWRFNSIEPINTRQPSEDVVLLDKANAKTCDLMQFIGAARTASGEPC